MLRRDIQEALAQDGRTAFVDGDVLVTITREAAQRISVQAECPLAAMNDMIVVALPKLSDARVSSGSRLPTLGISARTQEADTINRMIDPRTRVPAGVYVKLEDRVTHIPKKHILQWTQDLEVCATSTEKRGSVDGIRYSFVYRGVRSRVAIPADTVFDFMDSGGDIAIASGDKSLALRVNPLGGCKGGLVELGGECPNCIMRDAVEVRPRGSPLARRVLITARAIEPGELLTR